MKMSDRRNFSINQNLFNFNKKDKKIFRRAGDLLLVLTVH